MKDEPLKLRIKKGKDHMRKLEVNGEPINLTRSWNLNSVENLIKALEGGALRQPKYEKKICRTQNKLLY